MNKMLDVIVADPSGNITIMVLTPTDREEYSETARRLLENKWLNGQQVAFLLPDGKMEMCGLEFCGNASRAFAFYTAACRAMQSGDPADSRSTITVEVSGCDKPLTASVMPLSPEETSSLDDSGHMAASVTMEMPIPSQARILTSSELGINKHGLLVDMDGIGHLILEDVAPSSEIFEMVRHRIYDNIDPNLPAFGVMFYDTVNQLMTPAVYVKDVDTTYFEGSCASGTVAAAFALSQDLADGVYDFTMQQPEGVLHASVTKKQGRIEEIMLKGLVTLSDVISVEI